MREEIERLWNEVFKMREETGVCRNSPQKERAIRLMHRYARRGEKEKRWVQRKMVGIRLRLAELDYQEGDYASAHLQINKASHLCKEIDGSGLMAELRALEREIYETQVLKKG